MNIIKNHTWQNGQLLQTNKKWSALKEKQRTWIQEITAREHMAYVEEYGKLPMQKNKGIVLDKVYHYINEREIWIPYGEFRTHISKMIDRLNHKSPLFLLPNKPPKKLEPKPPKVGIEEFPTSVQQGIKDKMGIFIASYKSQAGHVPYNKTRSRHIKLVLSWFNSSQWQSYEMYMMKSDTLLNIYDEVRNQYK